MPLNPAQYPMVNGVRYDHSSIVATILGVPFEGFKSIDYGHSLEPGEVRGTRAQLIGRTRGKYGAEASFEMNKSDYLQLMALIATAGGGVSGYMETSFDIAVTYSEAALGVVTDIVQGFRIKKETTSSSEGGDAVTVKVDGHVMGLLINGQPPMGTQQYLKP